MLIILYVDSKTFLYGYSKQNWDTDLYLFYNFGREKRHLGGHSATNTIENSDFISILPRQRNEHPCNLRIRKNGLLFKKEMYLFF